MTVFFLGILEFIPKIFDTKFYPSLKILGTGPKMTKEEVSSRRPLSHICLRPWTNKRLCGKRQLQQFPVRDTYEEPI